MKIYVHRMFNAGLIFVMSSIPLTACSQPERNEIPKFVGSLGNPTQIVFEGNETFSDRSIQKALRQTRSYLVAAHPNAPFKPFPHMLETSVIRGYLQAGFPDVEVDVSRQPGSQGDEIRVHIREGQRFKNGPILVTGGNSNLVAAIQQQLREGISMAPMQTGSADKLIKKHEQQQAEKESGDADTPEEDDEEPDPVWADEAYTAFHAEHLKSVHEHIEQACKDQGYFYAESAAEMKPVSSSSRTELHITIADAGPVAELRDIRFEGLDTITKPKIDAILELLELKSGESFDRQKLENAQRKLYRAARYTHAEIRSERVSPDSHQVDLIIALTEFARATPITKELDPSQEILLKHFQWWRQWPTGLEDLGVTFSYGQEGTIVRMALSPEQGLVGLARLPGPLRKEMGFPLPKDPVEAKDALLSDMIFWLSADRTGICLPGMGEHLSLPGLPNLTLWMNTKPPTEPDGQFSISAGAGTASEGSRAPLSWDLRIHPLTVYKFTDYQFRRENGGGLFRMEKEESAHSIRLHDNGVLIASNGRNGNQVTWDLLPKPDAYVELSAVAAKAAAATPNSYDPDRPFSSILDTLAGWAAMMAPQLNKALTSDDPDKPPAPTVEEIRQAAEGIRFLADRGLFNPLDHHLVTANEDDSGSDYFKIPYVGGQPPPENVMLFLVAGLVHGPISELLPETSWPVKLTREATYMSLGHTQYSGPVFEALYRDNSEIGPIGYLCISSIMKFINPGFSPKYARRGLDGLTATDFEKDWRLLIPEDAAQRQRLSDLLTALGKLTPEEQQALGLHHPELSPLFKGFMERLNSADHRSLPEMLAPAMAYVWDASLRPIIEAKLTQSSNGIPPDSALIAATVNGVPIEWMTIDLIMAAHTPASKQPDSSWKKQKQQQVYQALVIGEAVYQDFQRKKPDDIMDVSAQLIQQLVDKELDGDPARLNAYLISRGMSQQQMTKSLLTDHVVAELRKEVPPPADAEMKAFFKEHESSFFQDQKYVHLHMISAPLVSVDPPRDSTAQKAHFERIRADLEQGADFGDQARAHSQDARKENGGCYGNVAFDDLAKPFKTFAETAEDNQLSDVIEAGDKLHLIKITERRDAGAPAFEDVKSSIRKKLLQQKQQTAVQGWVQGLMARTDLVTFKRSTGSDSSSSEKP